MNMSDMKNIVVLKNLPSNLVEEAIVVLKENKKVHRYKIVDVKEKEENDTGIKKERKKGKETSNLANEKNDNKYIIKEAEMLIKSYTENLEKKSSRWKNNMKKLEKRYKFSLKLNFLLFFTSVLGFIFVTIT